MSTIKDERTEEQRRTHSLLVIGTDKFLSGWGEAKGIPSYAAWACEPKDSCEVERWVRRRTDMLRVRIAGTGYRPRGPCHLHIYVVGEEHPARRG